MGRLLRAQCTRSCISAWSRDTSQTITTSDDDNLSVPCQHVIKLTGTQFVESLSCTLERRRELNCIHRTSGGTDWFYTLYYFPLNVLMFLQLSPLLKLFLRTITIFLYCIHDVVCFENTMKYIAPISFDSVSRFKVYDRHRGTIIKAN